MVVRVNVDSVGFECLRRQRGQDLVGVHVRRGSRAGLEHVDGEVSVEFTGDDLICGVLDGGGAGFVEHTELEVGLRRSLLHLCQRGDVSGFESLARDREVLDGTLGLCAVEGVLGDFDLTHGVVFDAKFFGHCCPFRWVPGNDCGTQAR